MSTDQLSNTVMSVLSSCPMSERSQCTERVQQDSLLTRISRNLLHKRLSSMSTGQLLLTEAAQTYAFGDAGGGGSVDIQVHSPNFYKRTIAGGAMGAAESYLDGEWSSSDLTQLFQVLFRNSEVLQKVQSWTSGLSRLAGRFEHLANRNSKSGSRKNIQEHYDLGNEFFQLFLDPSMMYSSALFTSPGMSLEDASWEKLDRICRTLELSPADHVVEIGTGWGGFALYAAQKYGCRVTTTTISEEQFRFATERIRQAGISDRVTVLQQDYRDLTGQYDKLVSIEMIEAVGKKYLPTYFETCNRLLKPDGAMLIQAITIPEQRYESYSRSVDFIQKYIFPGGFLPSVSAMQSCIAKSSNLTLVDCYDFGLHYAKTLRLWSERFHTELEAVKQLGFNDRFIRMWRYYLSYCEAAFLERATGVVQAVWTRPGSSIGICR